MLVWIFFLHPALSAGKYDRGWFRSRSSLFELIRIVRDWEWISTNCNFFFMPLNMTNYLWRIIFIVRFLFRRINRIFPIVSYSFSTSNIPSITKIKEYLSSSIKILLGVRGLEILHRSYNVSRRFIKLSTFSIRMTPFTESTTIIRIRRGSSVVEESRPFIFD